MTNIIKFAVLDTETTGLDPETCDLVEIAYVVVSYDKTTGRADIGGSFETYVNPGVPIPPEVSAIHHIIDEDVEGAPSPAEAVEMLRTSLAHHGVHVIAAHNARFDEAFILKHVPVTGWIGAPWVCTQRMAIRHMPNLPGYSNQTLRYALKIKGIDRHGPTHRALFDARVTAGILVHMLENGLLELARANVEPAPWSEDLGALLAYSSDPIEIRRFYFGKHRGKLLSEVPIDYLRWCSTQGFGDPDLSASVKKELARRLST